MRRVSSTFSHLALIALAVTALCIGTIVWLWELACAALATPAVNESFAADDLQTPEIDNATTSAAD